MREIKQNFEAVVRENMSWLLAYIRNKTRNSDIAEDLLQEVWLKAYLSYDQYYEDGHLRSWLMRIAQNHLRNYFSQNRLRPITSLDASENDEDSLYAYLSDGRTVEEEYLIKEQIESVLSIIARLPSRQRQVVTCRYLQGRSMSETAYLLQIPEGTVKSASHYAVRKIRESYEAAEISDGNTPRRSAGSVSAGQSGTRKKRDTVEAIASAAQSRSRQKEEVKKMKCNEIYKYLFVYANKTITPEDKAKVEAHIAECRVCGDIASALEKLIPTMVFAREDETTHFLIDFPDLKISFSGVRSEIENYELLNEQLAAWNGNIPENENWMVSGYGKDVALLGTFDNEGNEIKFFTYDRDSFHKEHRATYIKKMFHYMWEYSAYENNGTPYGIRKAKEAPNLFYGDMRNTFGNPVKSALYQAIPGTAENIRIRRGSGVIDCGTYKFPYVDRYIAGDEMIALEYSFNN